MTKQFDSIIIGSGIGGLSFALNLANYWTFGGCDYQEDK
jgi:thioredoxin reductase